MYQETRRDFLRQLPPRLAVLGLLTTSLNGCAPQPSVAIEPKTPAEIEISPLIQLFKGVQPQVQERSERSYSAAVTLAKAKLEGRDYEALLKLYTDIREPNKQAKYSNFGAEANLAYAAHKYGRSAEGTSPMAGGRDLDTVHGAFGRIKASGSFSNDACSILTSTALISSESEALDVYRRVDSLDRDWWFSDREPAALTLAAILGNRDIAKVTEIHDYVKRYEFDRTLDATKMIRSVLVLSGIVGGNIDDIIEMFVFAGKKIPESGVTASGLVLAAAAQRAESPVISRTGIIQFGKVSFASIVPIILS